MSFIWGDKTAITDIIKANQEPTYIVPVDLIESSERIDALQSELDTANEKLERIREWANSDDIVFGTMGECGMQYYRAGKAEVLAILDGGDTP